MPPIGSRIAAGSDTSVDRGADTIYGRRTGRTNAASGGHLLDTMGRVDRLEVAYGSDHPWDDVDSHGIRHAATVPHFANHPPDAKIESDPSVSGP